MKYTYRSGYRPLEGYTIKRGVGQGGFGEVYFALSDSGKEVALKLLKGPTEIELRGVANCLNFKHPNLVHIYDLRTDERGDAWLVMEYIVGESLADMINRHPSGLPENLVREWFPSLCRAVGFLHDHGIVHRDLKPANIFVENGSIKVGDYGLCKAMGSSMVQRQTEAIGTLHYMAPEVSTGNYNRQIDIYACGVILYEMLTGRVPFDGQSEAEILMKHMTAEPDLETLPEIYRKIVGKALDKNPVQRFTTMTEFGRAVQDAGEVEFTMAIREESLAGYARSVGGNKPPARAVPAQKAAPAVPFSLPPGQGGKDATVITGNGQAVDEKADPARSRLNFLSKIPFNEPTQTLALVGVYRDTLLTHVTTAFKLAFFLAIAVGVIALITDLTDWPKHVRMYLVSLGLGLAVLIGSFGASYFATDSWFRRLRTGALGGLVGLSAFLLAGWETPRTVPTDYVPNFDEVVLYGTLAVPADSFRAAVKYVIFFAAVLAFARWWRVCAWDRKGSFSTFTIVSAAFVTGLLCFLWPWSSEAFFDGALLPMLISIAALQLASPKTPEPPTANVRYRRRYEPAARQEVKV